MIHRGLWGVLRQGWHINALELRAIHLALWHFLSRLEGCHVLVRTDSTTVAAYVNRQGGMGYQVCAGLHCGHGHTRGFCHRAMHVLGVVNVAANLLSRGGSHPGNWRLHPAVVEAIWRRSASTEQ